MSQLGGNSVGVILGRMEKISWTIIEEEELALEQEADEDFSNWIKYLLFSYSNNIYG